MLGDHRLYHQILLNLLSNSIKFTPSGKQVQVIVTVHEVQQMEAGDADEVASEVVEQHAASLNGKLLRNIAD